MASPDLQCRRIEEVAAEGVNMQQTSQPSARAISTRIPTLPAGPAAHVTTYSTPEVFLTSLIA